MNKILKTRIDIGSAASQMIGKTFGRLTIVNYAGHCSTGKAHVYCKCSCGNTKLLDIYCIRSGAVRSCGCLHREMAAITAKKHNTTHGLSKSRTYSMWRDMLTRCYNPNFKFYSYYGGRGIGVCGNWLGRGGFQEFITDMGHPPGCGMSLERKDNNKGYSKENCVWLLRSQQSKNRLYNWQVFSNGKVLTAVEASKEIGRSRKYADQKLRRLGASKSTPVPISILL